ncbi:MAG: hypothetical protein IJE07_03105 [Clostridia bacterium]|nr:hypothetical protein [Clostridia bacterium]
MNKSIPVRILTVLGGLVLLAGSAGVVAEGFFGVPVLQGISGLLASDAAVAVLAKIVAALALAVLSAMAVVCALPGKAPQQSGSIMQKGEDGPIGITVGAICKMVQTCVAKHPEIMRADVDVREGRDGVIILLDVEQVGGVSIPLSVARLQKQIRKYVNGRTGLDVTEVRVMVDNPTDDQVASEFAVEDGMHPSAPVHTEEYVQPGSAPAEPLAEQLRQMAEMTTQPLPAEPAPVHEAPALPEQPAQPAEPQDLDELVPVVTQPPLEIPDEEDKPLHQRVFGAEEMPLTVPMPPEMAAEAAAEKQEEAATPAPEQQEAPVEEAAEDANEDAAGQEDWTDPSMQAAAEAVLSGDAEPDGGEASAEEAAADAEEAPEEAASETSSEEEAELPPSLI